MSWMEENQSTGCENKTCDSCGVYTAVLIYGHSNKPTVCSVCWERMHRADNVEDIRRVFREELEIAFRRINR